MKQKILPLLFILALTTSLLAITPTVTPTENIGIHGNLTMTSPNSQTTYSETLLVDFTIAWSVSIPIPWMHIKLGYRIDDGPKIALTNDTSIIFQKSSSIVYTPANTLLDISHLGNGKHKLTIIAEGSYNVNNDFVFELNYHFMPTFFYVNIFTPPDILILSPQSITYTVANTQLNFTIDTPTSWMGYSLDNQNNITLSGNTTIAGLNDGSHSLVVYANDTNGIMGKSQKVTFTIATPPKIQVLSPLNQTYTESSVSLIFMADKVLESMIYSLDRGENRTINNNVTLSNLPNGLHNLTIYAKDNYGNNAIQTVDFSILAPESSENTVQILVAILVVTIILCVVSVLLFRRHQKTTKSRNLDEL